MWIDTHCHLDQNSFLDEQGQDERERILEQARKAQVRQMVVIGSGQGMSEIENAVSLAKTQKDLFAAIAVHPHDVAVLTEAPPESQQGFLVGDALWSRIEYLVKEEPRIVAIGETGLDLHYEHSPLDMQVKQFDRFLSLAKQTKKPVSLHVRDAHKQALSMVKNAGGICGVVHCFTGTVEEARAWLDLGFLLSFSGIVTFPKAIEVQKACQFVPVDSMLLETDCPFLAPVPMRGKRNEPAYLVHTAACVSSIKQINMEELAIQTSRNAQMLFQLPNISV